MRSILHWAGGEGWLAAQDPCCWREDQLQMGLGAGAGRGMMYGSC